MDAPECLIIDTETNGREGDELEVIELGALAWPADWWPSVERRFLPKHSVLPEAKAVHGILDAELIGCPPSSEARLPEGVRYVIGHNVDYDADALGLGPEIKRVCTYAISRRLWPEFGSHKLGALMYTLLPEDMAKELVSGAHGAMADCLMVAELLEWIQSKAGDWDLKTPEGLWHFSEECRTPTHMPFGKHKGELLSAMPKDYVGWALRTCEDMDPYLRKALEKL